MPHDVFVSYSSLDSAVAAQVRDKLESVGLSCWMAPGSIPPGTPYARAIAQGIRESSSMVVVFSQHANESDPIEREVELAVDKRIPVIPFRIEDVAPSDSFLFYLKNVQWLEAFGPHSEDSLENLVTAVTHHLTGERPPPDDRSASSKPSEMSNLKPRPQLIHPVRKFGIDIPSVAVGAVIIVAVWLAINVAPHLLSTLKEWFALPGQVEIIEAKEASTRRSDLDILGQVKGGGTQQYVFVFVEKGPPFKHWAVSDVVIPDSKGKWAARGLLDLIPSGETANIHARLCDYPNAYRVQSVLTDPPERGIRSQNVAVRKP